MGGTDKNYLSWQQTGWDWYMELRLRRQSMPIYESQEKYLKGLLAAKAAEWLREKGRPLKVLEFGCGFGRHLKYLHRIEGLDVYGCDQSPAMIQTAHTLLCGQFPELRDRIILVEPKGRLPYEDGAFDVAYTVSVLLHVSPEDLHGRTAELRRVAGHMVVNVEPPPAPHSFLWDEAHDGCWLHDLVGAHRAAGPCRMEVDADALAPLQVVCRVFPDAGGLRVLHKGQWTDDPGQIHSVLTDVLLEFAKYSREQAQRRSQEASAQLSELRQAVLQLQGIQQSRAFRVARWFGGHPRLKSVLGGIYTAVAGGRQLVLRAFRPTRRAEAGPSAAPPAPVPAALPPQEPELTLRADVAAASGPAESSQGNSGTQPAGNRAGRENGY